MITTLKNYEKTERYLAERLFSHIPTINTYMFTEGKICYDTIITLNNGSRILGEIKVRSCEANQFPDYILQVDKLINLIKRAKLNGFELIYYINFFNNDKTSTMKDFIIFDLTPRIQEWKVNRPIVIKKYMNDATFKSKTYKVEKEVIMLKYDEKTDMRGTFCLN